MTPEKILQIRKICGLSQNELAKKVRMSQSAISQYEKGLRKPELASVIKFHRGLGFSYEWLLEGIE